MEEVNVNQVENPKRTRTRKPKMVEPNLMSDVRDHHGNSILLTEAKSKCRVYLCWWGEKVKIDGKRKTKQKSVIQIIHPKDYVKSISKGVQGNPNSWDNYLETKYNDVLLIHDPEVK